MASSSVITVLKQIKGKVDQSEGKFGLGSFWQAQSYIWSMMALLTGFIVGGLLVLGHRIVGLQLNWWSLAFIVLATGIGALGLLLWFILTIRRSIEIFNPISFQLDKLASQMEDENNLIMSLEAFSVEDLVSAKTRIEFEINSLDLRTQWFLGSSTRVALFPLLAAVGVFIYQLVHANPFEGLHMPYLLSALVIGFLWGALVLKAVSTRYLHYIYLLDAALERKNKAFDCDNSKALASGDQISA